MWHAAFLCLLALRGPFDQVVAKRVTQTEWQSKNQEDLPTLQHDADQAMVKNQEDLPTLEQDADQAMVHQTIDDQSSSIISSTSIFESGDVGSDVATARNSNDPNDPSDPVFPETSILEAGASVLEVGDRNNVAEAVEEDGESSIIRDTSMVQAIDDQLDDWIEAGDEVVESNIFAGTSMLETVGRDPEDGKEEDAPLSEKKFERLADVLLELAIEGHPGALRSILGSRNEILRKKKGDQESAVKEVVEYKEPKKSITESIAHFVLSMLPGIGLSMQIVYPIWAALRNTCLMAAVLGYDMNAEETRSSVILAFAGIKAVAGAGAGLTVALQMLWSAFAGPVAGLLPVGVLMGKITNKMNSKARAKALEKLREGKTRQISKSEYSEKLDPEPSMQQRLLLLKNGADETQKHAALLLAKAKTHTTSIGGKMSVFGSKSKSWGVKKIKSVDWSPWDSDD